MSAPKQPDQARSKIMRLAFPDRMTFNGLIRDGYTGRYLAKWLAEHGVPDVNAENIRKYKVSRHYKRWLDDERQIDEDKEKTEQAMQLVTALGGSPSEKLGAMLASKLFKIMPGMHDAEDLKEVVSIVSVINQAGSLEDRQRRTDQRERLVQIKEREFEIRLDQAKRTEDIVKDTTISEDERSQRIKEVFGLT